MMIKKLQRQKIVGVTQNKAPKNANKHTITSLSYIVNLLTIALPKGKVKCQD